MCVYCLIVACVGLLTVVDMTLFVAFFHCIYLKSVGIFFLRSAANRYVSVFPFDWFMLPVDIVLYDALCPPPTLFFSFLSYVCCFNFSAVFVVVSTWCCAVCSLVAMLSPCFCCRCFHARFEAHVCVCHSCLFVFLKMCCVWLLALQILFV